MPGPAYGAATLPTATRANTAALIPAYFEKRYLRDVVERVRRQLDLVLVVDDGSTDGTGEEACAGGAEVIVHPANRGKGGAIKTGLEALRARPEIEYILLLDGDGQHLPEEIPAFLAAQAETGAAMLLGNRMSDLRAMPLVRKLTNRYMSWQISQLCRQPIADSQCGFRMLHRALIEPILRSPAQNYDFETEMLYIASRRGCRISAVPVSTVYGEEKSKIRPVRDTLRFYRMLFRLWTQREPV